jgi:hypothetical protein
MALYLIAFNDEWVPELTMDDLRQRGAAVSVAMRKSPGAASSRSPVVAR